MELNKQFLNYFYFNNYLKITHIPFNQKVIGFDYGIESSNHNVDITKYTSALFKVQ